ncbi:zinc-ribbon domain-containing protein [Paenibacillus pini]|uniref:Zinc-ribbon domain-containing protein n=1 Tax=Paenibacillus pini JCM 16418 TaxID=1236976 RepID=W7YPC4_9BACL|nr:zinc-ribbon domain-containing protein [Paenibacillus pini]GAF06536.1 hypothetical protein JCM16418_495 [Paenibacillus pini JCM 16418]
METIIVWLICTSIFCFIMYNMISAAIDKSEMASNIQDIRDLLIEMKRDKVNAERERISIEKHEHEINEECPACGYLVRQNEKFCPECGLKLID